MKNAYINYIGWTVVCSLSLYFVYSNVIRYFNPEYSIYKPDFRSFAPYLILHIVGGMAALLVGPLQFLSSGKKQYYYLHKILGRIYLIAVLFSTLSAIYLAVFDSIVREHNFTFGTGTLGLSAAWLITSSMSYFAIRAGNVIQHKEWVIRSYVVTSGFVIFRLLYNVLSSIDGFPFKDDLGGVCAWACWSIPLLITEWVLQINKLRNTLVKKVLVHT